MNKTIVILCGGPPRGNRVRHLELINNKPCICHVIDACTIKDIKLCLLCSYDNSQLIKFMLEKYPQIKLLLSPNYTMLSSFQIALNEDNNDTLIVAGDLWNLKKENILKFLESPYKSAYYRLKFPWGKNLISLDNTLIRRGDIGDSLLLIADEHKKEYLSTENLQKAEYYFKKFYNDTFDPNWGNYLWTWLDYVFFFEISSSIQGINNIGNEKGAIYIDSLVYLDND